MCRVFVISTSSTRLCRQLSLQIFTELHHGKDTWLGHMTMNSVKILHAELLVTFGRTNWWNACESVIWTTRTSVPINDALACDVSTAINGISHTDTSPEDTVTQYRYKGSNWSRPLALFRSSLSVFWPDTADPCRVTFQAPEGNTSYKNNR